MPMPTELRDLILKQIFLLSNNHVLAACNHEEPAHTCSSKHRWPRLMSSEVGAQTLRRHAIMGGRADDDDLGKIIHQAMSGLIQGSAA
jgi:hypothetical protein